MQWDPSVVTDIVSLSPIRLLDVLAGRKDPRGLSGHLLIDGGLPPDNFKCMVGYVVQVSYVSVSSHLLINS